VGVNDLARLQQRANTMIAARSRTRYDSTWNASEITNFLLAAERRERSDRIHGHSAAGEKSAYSRYLRTISIPVAVCVHVWTVFVAEIERVCVLGVCETHQCENESFICITVWMPGGGRSLALNDSHCQ
jgi:hypothetical protein